MKQLGDLLPKIVDEIKDKMEMNHKEQRMQQAIDVLTTEVGELRATEKIRLIRKMISGRKVVSTAAINSII